MENQKKLGIATLVVTSARHPNGANLSEEIDGVNYLRTAELSGLQPPLVREWRLMHALRKTIDAAIDQFKPDTVYAHSPVLVGRPALDLKQAKIYWILTPIFRFRCAHA